jgi:hypothetical protein
MATLPPDWNEFIGLLNANRVRYLIVGAHALAANGRPRATCANRGSPAERPGAGERLHRPDGTVVDETLGPE